MENKINTLANGWQTIQTGQPPESWTPVTPAPPALIGGIPTPPNIGYYPEPTARSAVQTPDISSTDTQREYYENVGRFRRFWPKQPAPNPQGINGDGLANALSKAGITAKDIISLIKT